MSTEEKKSYTGLNLALLIPTKDRPVKMKNLLESLAAQDISCGRIIVVASGESIEELVLSFRERLPVEYYECDPPGQIRQRNLAISKLDDSTPLVGSLDDDIVLEDGSIGVMIDFWNNCEPETAGISFNIVNTPQINHSCLRTMTGMSVKRPGTVLRSGYNVPLSPAKRNARTRWLCGGATVWRQEILQKFTNCEIQTRWAICEDLIFSYPIGKLYPLYVCADSRVRHEHVYDHQVPARFLYYGRNATLWRFYFVESHPELSRLYFLWMQSGQILARFITGFFCFRGQDIERALGQLQGCIAGLMALWRGDSLISLLKEGDSD